MKCRIKSQKTHNRSSSSNHGKSVGRMMCSKPQFNFANYYEFTSPGFLCANVSFHTFASLFKWAKTTFGIWNVCTVSGTSLTTRSSKIQYLTSFQIGHIWKTVVSLCEISSIYIIMRAFYVCEDGEDFFFLFKLFHFAVLFLDLRCTEIDF